MLFRLKKKDGWGVFRSDVKNSGGDSGRSKGPKFPRPRPELQLRRSSPEVPWWTQLLDGRSLLAGGWGELDHTWRPKSERGALLARTQMMPLLWSFLNLLVEPFGPGWAIPLAPVTGDFLVAGRTQIPLLHPQLPPKSWQLPPKAPLSLSTASTNSPPSRGCRR